MPNSKLPIPIRKLRSFCKQYHISELALFGSAVREDFNADSDIDLLVDFDSKAQIGFLTLSKMQRELSALFQRPVDLVPKGRLHPLLYQKLKRGLPRRLRCTPKPFQEAKNAGKKGR